MNEKKILVVGTGGHARAVLSVIKSSGEFVAIGVLSMEIPDLKEKILDVPVIGGWPDLKAIRKKGITYAAIAIGDNKKRESIYKDLKSQKFILPALVHKKAFVETSAAVGNGAVVCAGVVVAAGAVIGEGSIINTGSTIDHETVIEPFVHVAPGCSLAGRIKIGKGTFLGIGTKIIDHITIGSWAILGAGAVVVENISSDVTAFGVPARVQK